MLSVRGARAGPVTSVLRVTDLSKPLEAESKLGCAPVVPSEFRYSYIHTYIDQTVAYVEVLTKKNRSKPPSLRLFNANAGNATPDS